MNGQRGFTLIELMVVVAIVAVLAAIAFPNYTRYVQRSKVRTAQADLQALAANAESHRQRRLAYPQGTAKTTDELRTVFPGWAPASKSADFGFAYAPKPGYTLTATGTGRLSGCTLAINAANVRTATAGCAAFGDVAW
ncbi:prepilin-type N-terminal cleavage/methylation domain-containing protein [Luteimonas sp. FCS-9]|uniref:type IV pilin protein n=1 Tax=Luteimonas sp. FCS-9 TaxID=1547516 RepID=UPI00063EC81E|nr:prepilin-type N-terminal cleavage/methylation domain-containing protein [Luteimonas sp. FCS-9]KLI99890.1 hypothetical protein WQ56_10860 [Luteimonas sp. FCS-9]